MDAGTTLATDDQAFEQINDLSGNGNHGVQTTSANQWLWRSNSPANNKPSIRSQVLQWTGSGTTFHQSGPISITNTLALDSQNLSVYIVARGVNGTDFIVGTNSGNTLTRLVNNINANFGPTLIAGSQTSGTGSTPECGIVYQGTFTTTTPLTGLSETYQVYSYRLSASATKLIIDGLETTTAAQTAATITGFSIGDILNAYTFNGEVAEVMVFASALSDADNTSIRQYLEFRNGVTEPDRLLIMGVESQINGGFGNPTQEFGASISDYLIQQGVVPASTRVINNGIGGQSLLQANANGTSYSHLVQLTVANQRHTVAVLLGGLNDFQQGQTEIQAIGSLINLAAQLRNQVSGSASCKVIAMSIPGGNIGGGSYDTQVAAYNAYLPSAVGSQWDAYWPLDSRLSDCTNTTWFTADGIHLNPAGKQLIASQLAPIVNSLW